MTHLDYTLTDPKDRVALVEKILEENPNVSEGYLEILGNYIIYCLNKEEKKQRHIITDNRKITINKRETSYEGLASQLENGEDGIYNMIDEGNKNAIFHPKVSISPKDIQEIPFLQQVKDAIAIWQKKLKTATGKDVYIIKKAIIELRKDQYLIKDAYKKPIQLKINFRSQNFPALEDTTSKFDENGYPIPEGISLLSPQICSVILCHYSELKDNSIGNFEGDTWYLMESFDNLLEQALKDYPEYRTIVECKTMNMPNIEIQQALLDEFGISHSVEYISSLWRKKIPALIALKAEDEYLDWYYLNVKKGKYKRCNRCGQIKLAHNKYFSKNKTSKDGFYSLCKECRNKKKGGKK